MKYLGKITDQKDLTTKEYVDNSISAKVSINTDIPSMDGTGAAGTSDRLARVDHVHPTDTSRANKNLIADDFSTSHPYEVGEYCIYNELLYKCSTAHSGAWNAAHFEEKNLGEELKFLEDTDNEKANIDGSYSSLTAGNAEQLVSTAGIEDKVPYSFRTSGGSADIGDRETDMVVGGTVAWNQAIPDGAVSSAGAWSTTGGTVSASDGVGKFIIDNIDGRTYARTTWSYTGYAGHKLYFGLWHRENKSGLGVKFTYVLANAGAIDTSSTDWKYASNIASVPDSEAGSNKWFAIRLLDGTDDRAVSDYIEFRSVIVVDLTMMFGESIADYIYSLEQATEGAGTAWFRKLFPNPYYAYATGSLQSVNISAHNMVGFNAYNNTTGKAKLVGGMQYQITGTYSALSYSTGETLTPDADGYFTPTENGELTITGGNATDTCVHLVWDGEKDGQFEPYEVNSYALDSSLTLRGISKLDSDNKLYYDGDTYESDGTVTRRFGTVNLGELNWTKSVDSEFGTTKFTASNAALIKAKSAGIRDIPNAFCDSYISRARYSGGGNNQSLIQAGYTGFNVYGDGILIVDSSKNDLSATQFKEAMNGKAVVYELATSVAETAEPYQNPQIVNDFGTEEYVDAGVTASTPTRDVAIPVGHQTFYQANLRAKLEMAPDSPSGNGDYIVRQTSGENSYVPIGSCNTVAKSADLAANYSPSKPYVVGDYCIYNSQLYRCTTAITTAEAWDSTHWTAAVLGNDVSDLQSALNVIDTDLRYAPKKNLIDFSKITDNSELRNGTGAVDPKTGWYVTDWIEVKPNTTYALSGTSSSFKAEVNEDKDAYTGIMNVTDHIFTTGSQTKYVRFNSVKSGYTTPQLEEGDTVTVYEPYTLTSKRLQKDEKDIQDLTEEVSVPSEAFEKADVYADFDYDSYIVSGYYVSKTATLESNSLSLNYAKIPVEQGEQYKITGQVCVNVTLYGLMDSNGSLLSVSPTTGIPPSSEGPKTVTEIVVIPSGVSYLAVNCGAAWILPLATTVFVKDGEETILKENVLIPRLDSRVSDIESAIASGLGNPLWGKKLATAGTSITYGAGIDPDPTSGIRMTYGAIVAKNNNMEFVNYGSSGSTLQYISGKNPFSDPSRYQSMDEDIDYLTIEFGWNDYAYGTLGEITDSDNTTFYGAWNVVLPWLIEHYPTTKIGLIVPYGTSEDMREAVRHEAKKWGVGFMDLTGNPDIPLLYNREPSFNVDSTIQTLYRTRYLADGVHPNNAGYNAWATAFEAFLKNL